jgi:hypothetical protein
MHVAEQSLARRSQYLDALDKGNAIRMGRAQVKREIRSGEKSIGEALELECVQGMCVWDLLKAQRAWGPQKTARVMNDVRVGQFRKVENLTSRQRALVAEATRGREGDAHRRGVHPHEARD